MTTLDEIVADAPPAMRHDVDRAWWSARHIERNQVTDYLRAMARELEVDSGDPSLTQVKRVELWNAAMALHRAADEIRQTAHVRVANGETADVKDLAHLIVSAR